MSIFSNNIILSNNFDGGYTVRFNDEVLVSAKFSFDLPVDGSWEKVVACVNGINLNIYLNIDDIYIRNRIVDQSCEYALINLGINKKDYEENKLKVAENTFIGDDLKTKTISYNDLLDKVKTIKQKNILTELKS